MNANVIKGINNSVHGACGLTSTMDSGKLIVVGKQGRGHSG